MVQSKRPTIRDVAEKAGVSKSLVSLVFASEGRVSEKNRKLVVDAAKKLGYTPNQWARSLRAGSGQFIGILVADLHNPLFLEVADIIRRIMAERGIFSFMSTAAITEKNGKPHLEAAPVQALLDLKPRSLLVVGGLPDHDPLRRAPATLPIVVALTSVRDLPNSVQVRSDDEDAMRMLVSHLVSEGHKKIAYMGPDDSLVATVRLDAYKKAMEQAGLKDETLFQKADRTEMGGYNAAKALLKKEDHPTAIIGYNDNTALGAQDAIEQHILAGGKSVAVTGYDNTFIAQLSRISLTSIEQEKEAIAQKVCELLTDEEEYKRMEGQEILMRPRLFIRQSSLTPTRN